MAKSAIKDGARIGVVKKEKIDPDRLGKGPLAFWFLNHDLEEGILRWQLQELKTKGFSGVFLHSRSGLKVPYGSRHWNEMIAFCVREAGVLGLEAWLYDEDPYPSGTAGGRVVMERPEYCATELLPVVVEFEKAGRVAIDLPSGALVAAYRVMNGEILRIDEEAGLVRDDWWQGVSSSCYYAPYSNGGPHWRAETRAPHYRIITEIPGPGVKIVAFVRNAVKQSVWGHYTDLLNPDAVALFIRYTHEVYGELLKGALGDTVPGIFTDEAKLKGALPWSAKVPMWFREIAGLDLFDVLPHLVAFIGVETHRIRWAYRKALAKGLRESLMMPVQEACGKQRLLLTGHISPEEDPIGQVYFCPGLMGMIGLMDLPGTDLIGALVGSRATPLLHLSPKIASSSAHGYGKRFVVCEAFAVRDWSQDLLSMTKAAHWLFSLGVNRLVTHGQFYSIDGLRKREAPPSQFYQAAYWAHFGAFSDMVERLSGCLSQGEHVAPVLLYYPEETFSALLSGVRVSDERAEAEREKLGFLIHRLLTAGFDFDLADDDLLGFVQAEGGEAVLNGERFEVVVVPGLYLSPQAWGRLCALEASGVLVLFVESEVTVLSPAMPVIEVGGRGSVALLSVLHEQIRPLWRADGELTGHQRRGDDGDLLFLCNIGDTDFLGEVALRFPGPYEVSLPQEAIWSGSDLARVEIPAGQGVLIRQALGVGEFVLPGVPLAVEWGEWSVMFPSENCLVLSEFRQMEGAAVDQVVENFWRGDFVDLLSPGCLNHAVGKSDSEWRLDTAFDWQGPSAPLRLVVDTDLRGEDHRFFLNGVEIGPFVQRRTFDVMNREADLTPSLREGRNYLHWVYTGAGLPWDAVRIFGQFEVSFPFGRAVPALLKARKVQCQTGCPTPPEQLGHSQYGGVVVYEVDFALSSSAVGDLKLAFAHLWETAEVAINDVVVGQLWCRPFEVRVPEALIQSGMNRLRVSCSCSPANYLQAARMPAGFLGPLRWSAVSGGSVL